MGASKDKSWQARLSQPAHALTESFVESLSFDRRLWPHDIAGSLAHAEMLAEVGLITKADFRAIRQGFKEIADDIEKGTFHWDPACEDIHMALEAALIARIGEPGKRLHTARSRNDQVALDLRLYVRAAIDDRIVPALRAVQKALVEQADRYRDAVMPSYTHLQRAQPICLAAYLLAYVEQFERDVDRFTDARRRADVCPLGSGAVAGSTLPIDRARVARKLGFAEVSRNSIDSTSDRDFVIDFLAAAVVCGTHLSRMAEDWILYASQEFGFLSVADAFCTGSSMMPQKRNLDVMELVRGKVGRLHAALSGILTLCKGLPQAYNRDLQEDKVHLFAADDVLSASLEIVAEVVNQTTFDRARLEEATGRGFLDATVLAEYLVGRKVPFREAHQCVGRLVAQAEREGCELADLSLEVFQEACARIGKDVYDYLGAGNVIRRYCSAGNAGPESSAIQIRHWRKKIGPRASRRRR